MSLGTKDGDQSAYVNIQSLAMELMPQPETDLLHSG